MGLSAHAPTYILYVNVPVCNMLLCQVVHACIMIMDNQGCENLESKMLTLNLT